MSLPDLPSPQLSWPSFLGTFVKAGRGSHVFIGVPKACLELDINLGKCIVSIYSSDPLSQDLIKQLPTSCSVQPRQESAQYLWDFELSNLQFLQEFFYLCSLIISEIQTRGCSLEESVSRSLTNLRLFMHRETPPLSQSQQVGLWGELDVLYRLCCVHGDRSLESWHGPENDVHDFRFSHYDAEVKTSTGKTRVHQINGILQLMPILNHSLYLMSILIAPSPEGLSLSSMVARLRKKFEKTFAYANLFEQKLALLGFPQDGSLLSSQTYVHREIIRIYIVDNNFPRIIQSMLISSLSQENASRIERINYTLNLEGIKGDENNHLFGELNHV